MTEYIPQNLVDTFVASVAKHFLSLEQRYALSRNLKAEMYGASGIEVVRPEDIGDSFFFLRLKLEGAALSIYIFYGDREHDLTCVIQRGDQKQSYALCEWLEVLGKSSLLVDHGGWVLTAERIETVVAQYERILEQLAPALLSANSMESELEQQRLERFRQTQQQEIEREHSRQAFRASEAFHIRDFKAVANYLASVQAKLTPSEQAMLTYARKRINKST